MVRPVREIEQAAVGCRFHENRLSYTAHFFSSKAVLYNANEDPPGWVVPAYVPFGRIECVAVECRFSRKKTGAQPAYSVTATTIVESRRIIGKGSGAHLPALHCVLSRYAVTCVISVHVYISFKSISIFICRPSLSTATAARGSAFNGNHCSRPATSVGRQAVADRKSAISGRCCYLQI